MVSKNQIQKGGKAGVGGEREDKRKGRIRVARIERIYKMK